MNRKKERLKKYSRLYDFYKRKELSGRVSPEALPLVVSRIRYFESILEKLTDCPFILSDDLNAIDLLQEKIDSIQRLSGYFKKVNQEFRDNGKIESRLTPFWESIFLESIAVNGIPVSSKKFDALRSKLKYYRRRIEKIESAKKFIPFKINGVSVIVSSGQIKIFFPVRPPPHIIESLKKPPLRLKYSVFQKAWVRKFTGQGDDFFNLIKVLLTKNGGI